MQGDGGGGAVDGEAVMQGDGGGGAVDGEAVMHPPNLAPPAADPDPAAPPARKRRRRKKQFPEMIPSHGLRVLRANTSSRSGSADGQHQLQIADATVRPRRGRGRPPGSGSSQAREPDSEALTAASVGFPVDSLTEEEIEANVVPRVGGDAQAKYIVVRNHIVSLWRSNPTAWVTEAHAMESIRSEHRTLVSAAYAFLLDHSHINFGLAPAILSRPLPPPIPASIVIIGAGLAGIAAARKLTNIGFKVVILEGRSRPGGRVLTHRMHGSGHNGSEVVAAVDLGGSVITGINGNPLAVMARQLGFPLHKVRDKCPLYLPDGRPVDPDMDSLIEVAFNQLLDKVCKLRHAILDKMKSVDVSLGAALEDFRETYHLAESAEERMLLNWHLANLEYANATKLSNLSMAYWDQDDPYEMGGDHCFIPGGNSEFVRAFADGIPIIYDRTVTTVVYASDGVIVYADGQAFRCDMALCTVPLGVLKKGSIQFVPELPSEKQEAIKRLGFGLLNKVAMLFPHVFWDGGIDTFGHLTEAAAQRGEFFLIYSYSSVSGGPLLVALVAGESAINFEATTPTDPVNRVLSVLRGIFAPQGIEVPDPVQVICTRWGTDKFTYGSYSYVVVGSSGDDYDVLAESVGGGSSLLERQQTGVTRRRCTELCLVGSGRRLVCQGLITEDVLLKKLGENVKEDTLGLDDLFRIPDQSFGTISVLYDPCSEAPDSTTLMRVRIKEGKSGDSSLFLYGLIPRKHVMELREMDGDNNKLNILCRVLENS